MEDFNLFPRQELVSRKNVRVGALEVEQMRNLWKFSLVVT